MAETENPVPEGTQSLTSLLTLLRRSERAFTLAAGRRESAIAAVVAEGFDRPAVELAMRLMVSEPTGEFKILEQASEILEKSQAAVRVSMVAYVEEEEGPPNKAALRQAYESGVEHRLAEMDSRSCPFSHGELAKSWLRGWKEAYQVVER